MRIAIVSAPKHGKEDFIQQFLKTWPNYKKSPAKYLDVINNNLELINKQGDKANRDLITNAVVDEMMEYQKDDNIIHDCCPLDTLVSTLWCSQQEGSDIDEEFIKKSIKLTHVSLTFLDLIIFLPILKGYSDLMIEDNVESLERDEINNLFLAIQDSYNKGDSSVFPFETPEGSPALVEIFGNTAERIQMVKLYLNEQGQPYGKNSSDSLITLPDVEVQSDLDKIVQQNLTPSQPNNLKLVK